MLKYAYSRVAGRALGFGAVYSSARKTRYMAWHGYGIKNIYCIAGKREFTPSIYSSQACWVWVSRVGHSRSTTYISVSA